MLITDSGRRIAASVSAPLAAAIVAIAARGSRAYGQVTAVDRKRGTLSVTLTDLAVGDQVVEVGTGPYSVPGGAMRAQSPQPFTLTAAVQVHVMTNVAVRQGRTCA